MLRDRPDSMNRFTQTRGSLGLREVCTGWSKLLQHFHLLQELVGALSFDTINTTDGEADVNHHIIADRSLGNKIERNLANNASKLHASNTHLLLLLYLKNLSWNGKAHADFSSAASTTLAAATVCDLRHIPM